MGKRPCIQIIFRAFFCGGHMEHDFDENAICKRCGFDGAEAYHLRQILKAEIGIDEYNYRLISGEFEHESKCDS